MVEDDATRAPAVGHALDRAAGELCSALAFTLAGLLIGFSVFELAFAASTASQLLPIWAASALLLAALGFAAAKRRPAHGHAMLALVLAIPLLDTLHFLSITRDPVFTTLLLLVVLAHAVLGLHAGWHLAIAAPAVAGWIAIVATDPGPAAWVPMGVVLAASVAVGGLAQILRVQDRSRLERSRLRAEEGEARLRALQDASMEGIALHERGTILLVNPALAAMLGHTPGSLVGRHALDLVAPASRPEVEARLALGASDPYEILLERRDGTRLHAEIASREFPFEGRTVQVTAVRDVSARRAAAEAAGERDRLRALNEVRTRFINDAAHQLNTPLTPIKLSAHMLARGALGPLSEKQAMAVSTIQRNAEQLAVLARMLLDTAELANDDATDAGATTDAGSDVRDAIGAHAERARNLGVRIETRELPVIRVRADSGRLARAMRGLVGELLDAAAPGTTISIDAALYDGHAYVRLVRAPPEGSPQAREATDAAEHLYVDLARRLVAPHGGTLEARVEGGRREYVLGLRLADVQVGARRG